MSRRGRIFCSARHVLGAAQGHAGHIFCSAHGHAGRIFCSARHVLGAAHGHAGHMMHAIPNAHAPHAQILRPPAAVATASMLHHPLSYSESTSRRGSHCVLPPLFVHPLYAHPLYAHQLYAHQLLDVHTWLQVLSNWQTQVIDHTSGNLKVYLHHGAQRTPHAVPAHAPLSMGWATRANLAPTPQCATHPCMPSLHSHSTSMEHDVHAGHDARIEPMFDQGQGCSGMWGTSLQW